MMFIQKIINQMTTQHWVYYPIAILLTSVFWISGLTKILHFDVAMAEMAHFNLQPAALFVSMTILVQLLGSLLVILGGRWIWLGAGALSIFTLATIPIAHRFWEMPAEQGALDLALVQEHFSLIGGLVFAVIVAEFYKRKNSPNYKT